MPDTLVRPVVAGGALRLQQRGGPYISTQQIPSGAICPTPILPAASSASLLPFRTNRRRHLSITADSHLGIGWPLTSGLLSVTSHPRCRLWETCANGDILHVDSCGGLLPHPMDTDAT